MSHVSTLYPVHWDHEARKPGELTVKRGDTVSLVVSAEAPKFWVIMIVYSRTHTNIVQT